MSRSERFHFIDQFRGLVGVLMLLGHSSYYFNAVWRYLDPIDPVFDNWPQFALRYLGYICAPGFLMMNGAMVWYSYTKRRGAGDADWSARWHLIQRGLFLVLVQMTWVNSSWGGFAEFKPGHLGIIACIGLAMVFLTLFVDRPWPFRLGIGLGLFAVHPLLLRISYDPSIMNIQTILMQTFVDSGEFNKYPVLPWLGLAAMGSVMAEGWICGWKTADRRVLMGLGIGIAAILLATFVRLGRGYGNLFPFTSLGAYSFFIDQKYPPSLYHNLWFFGSVSIGVAAITTIGRWAPKLPAVLGIVGRVPLFFYCVHIGILGIFSKRIGIYYREGGVAASLVGFALMLVVMLPLAAWFGGVKRRSKNYLIGLI